MNFSGWFKAGKIEGHGTITFSNGQRVRGYFCEDRVRGAALVENYNHNKLDYTEIDQEYCLQNRGETKTS
jgi:hypothetical protein